MGPPSFIPIPPSRPRLPAFLLTLPLLCARALSLSPDRVHAFYYLWYGTPERDGQWQHWDHEVLPHWTPDVSKQHPEIGTRFSPPQDIHSPFYPASGPYSSKDPDVILRHLNQMADAGVGVAVLSWWGHPNRTGTADTQGVNTDDTIATVFQVAEQQHRVQLAFHLEPYVGRTAMTVREDVAYLLDRFGASPALFRRKGALPMFYIYDSYLIEKAEWAQVLGPGGEHTLRHTEHDGVFIGLWLENGDFRNIKDSHFNGAYSYFASEGMTYGSTWAHWNILATILRRHKLLFIPSVGPGYDDTLIRPWNAGNKKERDAGRYYEQAWQAALGCDPEIVSVTSFNEWGEGTQIEPAKHEVRSTGEEYQYYGVDQDPSFYIHLTARMCRGKAGDDESTAGEPRLEMPMGARDSPTVPKDEL